MKESQFENEVYHQYPIPKHVVSPHVQVSTPPRDSVSDSPHPQGPMPHKERGRDSSLKQTNNEGPKIQKSEHENSSMIF